MHALAGVRREIGSRDSAGTRKYLREFTQAFRKYDAILDSEQVQGKIIAASMVLVGDYHALPASQGFTASLIEGLGERRVVLGVEAILSRDQQILDAWWRREMAGEELRRRLRFDREWGYEWEPFYKLLIAAREHADGIYGLDCMPRDDLRRIRSRDRHAALKICEIRKRHPNIALVVLFGESHMAPKHLPRMLRKSLPQERMLTVLQNVDALYWQAMDRDAAAVSLGDEVVCVFNSSPLEKYESYRLCFERWSAAADDAPDFAPAVYNLILSLARALGFRLNSPRNGTQPKFLADSLPEVSSDVKGAKREIAERLERQGCAYAAETNTFLIREFQMANVAAEATRFLHHACRGMTNGSRQAQSLEDALAHFGARLLCPAANPEDGPAPEFGEPLYQAYIEGKIAAPALRRIFLTHLHSDVQAQAAWLQLAACCGTGGRS